MRWTSLLLWMPVATAVAADPLDLTDARPRGISVAFEVSPTERPDALDAIYSEPMQAWLEPDSVEGQLRVRVPGAAMERLLADREPLPGSFSDYVWTFDARSGDVVAAGFQGRLHHPVALGFFATHVETEIDVRVGTRDAVGFRAPEMQLGQIVFDACVPGAAGCTRVDPVPLDPQTGYVNAVGTIRARALGRFGAVTFAPIGEAVFSELPRETELSRAP
jgi:hypothetical protein